MIVRNIETLRGTEREVHGNGWVSTRLLLAKDGMGFSLHETIVPSGKEIHMHYKHHLEAVYCIKGKGSLLDKASAKTHAIFPGICYALNKHDEHMVTATEELSLICVFNPPVTGQEVHGKDGAYPLMEE